MTGLLDKETVKFPCPYCRHEVAQAIGKLKLNPKLTCRACRQDFSVDGNQLRTAIQKIEKSLADLRRTLSRLGK